MTSTLPSRRRYYSAANARPTTFLTGQFVFVAYDERARPRFVAPDDAGALAAVIEGCERQRDRWFWRVGLVDVPFTVWVPDA